MNLKRLISDSKKLPSNVLEVLDILLQGGLISYKKYDEMKSKSYSDSDLKKISYYADILLNSNYNSEIANTVYKFLNC